MLISFLRPGLLVSLFVLAALGLGLALAGAGAGTRMARDADRLASAYTVRLLSPASDDGMRQAIATLMRVRGVASAAPLDAARAAALLNRWGGDPVDQAALPKLNLIEVTARGDSAASRLADALKAAGLRAEVYGSGPADAGPREIARQTMIAGLLGTPAALLALMFAAGAAARTERTRLALWAEHGAARGAVLAAFGRAGAEAAFLAGAAALVAAVIAAPGMRMLAGEAISYGAMISALSASDVLVALATPLAAAAAAALGARFGAAGAFDRADRLG